MNKTKYILYTAAFAVCFSLFNSCDSIPNPFNRNDPENTNTRDYESDPVVENSDSIDKTKEDSIAKAKEDSIAELEASIKAKELQDKLVLQGDSINDLNNRLASLEKKSNDSIDKASAYTFMIFEFIILFLIIMYLYVKIRKLENRTQKIKRTLSDIPQSSSGISENHVLSLINREIRKMADQINSVNRSQDSRVDDIVNRLNKLEGSQDAYSQYSPSQQQTKQEQKHEDSRKSDVFYMPRTMTSMQFEDSKKKYSKDDTAFFKFTIKKHGNAIFIFDPYDESYIGRAYDDRDSSLLTVCELETKNATPKAFKNIEPGEAELRGNVWVVTKKLKLQYV